MHADRSNRFALLSFGLVLLVAGAGAMALSVGLFGTARSHHVLFDNFVSRYIGNNGTWFWPAAAGLGFVVAMLAAWWIVILLVSTDRTRDLTMPGARRRGRTELKSSALTSAVCSEIESYRGVDNANARTVGSAHDPRLVIVVTARRGADLADIRERIEAEALAHARAAMGRSDLPIRLDINLGKQSIRRI